MVNVVTNPGSATAPSNISRTIDASRVKNLSPNYSIELFVKDAGNLDKARDSSGNPLFPMKANIDEKFNMGFHSTWDSPFGKSSVGDIASKLFGGRVSAETIDSAVGAAGFGSKLKAQSAQIWTGSSPMQFSFNMKFNAIDNTEAEIKDRHRALLKLAAPSEAFGAGSLQILRAPGPTIADAAINPANSRCIDLRVGNYLFLRNVVITSVSSDVDALFDAKGIPIAMTIAVEIVSFYSCFTTEDIDKMFDKQ